MAKLKDEQIKAVFQDYLKEDEEIKYWAFGVKQPNFLLIVFLIALFILPGIIAVIFLTKNYIIALTDKRFIALQIKSISNAEVTKMQEYNLHELDRSNVKTSMGTLFTKIKIDDQVNPFAAKFHRAFSKNNRTHALAIGEAITSTATN
jgi:hypothetical protein